MQRGTNCKINVGLSGVVLGIGVIKIALEATGKRFETKRENTYKHNSPLKVLDIVAGCSLDEFGAAVVTGWANELNGITSAHLSSPKTCHLVVNQIEMLQDVEVNVSGQLQPKQKASFQNISATM